MHDTFCLHTWINIQLGNSFLYLCIIALYRHMWVNIPLHIALVSMSELSMIYKYTMNTHPQIVRYSKT